MQDSVFLELNIIGQAIPNVGKELKFVDSELSVIAQHLAPIVPSFTLLRDNLITVQGVLDALTMTSGSI